MTQTKHAYNQQCGRSTGARTRTEPAFWALLSARPADVADDGRHRSYLPIVNHESSDAARPRHVRLRDRVEDDVHVEQEVEEQQKVAVPRRRVSSRVAQQYSGMNVVLRDRYYATTGPIKALNAKRRRKKASKTRFVDGLSG